MLVNKDGLITNLYIGANERKKKKKYITIANLDLCIYSTLIVLALYEIIVLLAGAG